ncbi:MAG TPA: S41 family peptidase [Saprospiraceae bacterium]|nr:S41 family peptidase [Saprospiraceae bacterium]
MVQENNEEQNINPKKYEIWQPFLLAIMMSVGMLLGYKMNDKTERLVKKVDSSFVSLGRVEEVIRFIESRYVDGITPDTLMEEAIKAIIKKLDPHSIYLSPAELEEVNETMDGSFKGIGIESYYIQDTVVILKVVSGSPADRAGLKQLDQIIAIDDTLVAGVKMSFDSIRERLRSSNQSVKLEIKRKGVPQGLIKNVSLDQIAIHSADVAYKIDDSTAYIQIKQFSSNTYQEFMENLEKLVVKEKAKNLILDLRGNPGGYLPQATKIINQLIKENEKIIVFTEGRNAQRQDYLTNGKTFFNVGKIAVLVDEYSASGSEVIAGAIQDHDRGIIIGRRTYGKGLVQEQFPLSNGGAIRLTTARYFTPSGRSIQKEITDLASYEDEVYQRSPFEANTRDAESKKKIFHTLNLRRPVYGGGGIDPEIFIAGDSIEYGHEFQVLQSQVMPFLCTQMLQGKITLEKEADINALTASYLVYLKNTDPTYVPNNKIKNKVAGILKQSWQYLKSNGDPIAQAKEAGKEDAFITAALKYTRGQVKLK